MAIRIQVEWTGLGGAPYLTTLYHVGAGQVQADIAAENVGDFIDALRPCFSSALTATVLPEAVDYSTPDTPVDVYPVASSTYFGTTAQAVASRATQGLIRLRTNAYRGARRVQGRVFIPGVTVEAMSGNTGRPTSTYLGYLAGAAAVLEGGDFVVASRAGNDFYPLVQAAPWNEWAVLRSRRD